MSPRRPARCGALSLVALVPLWIGAASAQESPAAQRDADERFQEGKALLAQGDVAAACQKFEQSLALLRRAGTLLNLAVCRETEGRYATAMRLFQTALDAAIADKRADREKLAREHLAAVRPKLSWIEVKPEEGADLPDLTIACDGQTIPRESWGSPMPFDTGAHRVIASAPGRVSVELAIKLAAPGDRESVRIRALAPIEAPAPPATSIPSAEPSATVRAAASTAPSSASASVPVPPATSAPLAPAPGPWRGPAGIAALAAGFAAGGVGVVFGIKAIVDNDATLSLCPDSRCPTDEGITRNQDARAAALVANITLPVGLVAAGLGVFLLATSRAGAPPAPQGRVVLVPGMGPQGGSLWLRGSW